MPENDKKKETDFVLYCFDNIRVSSTAANIDDSCLPQN